MRVKKPKKILSKNPIGNLGGYAHAAKMPTGAKIGTGKIKRPRKPKAPKHI